jgi:hypothetical protein
MVDPGTAIDRNEERLARLARGEAMQRARSRRVQRKAKQAGGRAVRAASVIAAIVLGLLLWGLIIGPIGTTVLVLAVLFGGMAAMAAAIWDGPDQTADLSVEVPPAVLPATTDVWLDRQRRNLPALVRGLAADEAKTVQGVTLALAASRPGPDCPRSPRVRSAPCGRPARGSSNPVA